MLSYNDMAAEIMEHFINHDSAHGYSQINRNGTAEIETLQLSDGTVVEFNSGDRDCSRLIQTCYVVIGVLPRGLHMWTGNERAILLSNGFLDIDPRYASRGDVLLREGHTEMYLGEGMCGGARMSEHGTIDGEIGDQTHYEICKSEYNPYEWSYCFRYPIMREENKMPKPFMCIIHPEPLKQLYYVNDSKIVPIKTETEKLALMDCYHKATGEAMPFFKVSVAYWQALNELYKRL